MDEPTTAPIPTPPEQLTTQQILELTAKAGEKLYYSDMTVDGKRLTWKEVAEHQHEEIVRLQRFASMVYDLDRNERGRHQGDADTSDPTGVSQGNPYIQEGYVFGYAVHGNAVYALPPKEQRHNPDAYVFKNPALKEK